MANVVANTGKAIITNRVHGAGTEPLFIAWGTGAGTSAATDTTLFTEDYSTTNNGTGNQRTTGTGSQITTSTTNDTYQVTGTVTAAHSTAVTNAGLFDTLGTSGSLVTAPSGGNLFVKSDFSVVNLNSADQITFTFDIQLS